MNWNRTKKVVLGIGLGALTVGGLTAFQGEAQARGKRSPMARMLAELDLTEAQKEEFKALRAEVKAEKRELRESRQELKAETLVLLQASEIDAAALHAIADHKAALAAELQHQRVDHFLDGWALLEEDQQQQARERLEKVLSRKRGEGSP